MKNHKPVCELSSLVFSHRLLNVLEVVAPFKHFNKLREFVQMKLPPGFPVKLGKVWLRIVLKSLNKQYFPPKKFSTPLMFFVFLQTSRSFLPSQPLWHFRSFATMDLKNAFLPFPTSIKKTQAASPTFNLSLWTMNRPLYFYKTYLLNNRLQVLYVAAGRFELDHLIKGHWT